VTTTDQIKFQYIRADSAAGLTVTQSVSERGFAAIYQAVLSGTYPITTVQAAETGDWWPMDVLSTTTDLGAVGATELFAASISQTVSVINQSGSATYIALIQAHQIAPLSLSYLQGRQEQAVEKWLSARRKSEFILTWADRVPVLPLPAELTSQQP
jgi:hypothetical protein